MGRPDEAQATIADSLSLDHLDFRIMAEQFLLTRSERDRDVFVAALEGDVQTLLDVSFDLAWSGSPDDAMYLLQHCSTQKHFDHPVLWFTLAWLASGLHKDAQAAEYMVKAEASPSRYCFPARLEEMVVLKSAITRNPSSAKAYYYLGNLYYDKRRIPMPSAAGAALSSWIAVSPSPGEIWVSPSSMCCTIRRLPNACMSRPSPSTLEMPACCMNGIS